MKITYPLLGLLLAATLARPVCAQGPALDPGFLATGIYAPGEVYAAYAQPDGKIVLAGNFTQAGPGAAPGLARLLPGGTQADPVFGANVAGLQGFVSGVFALPANEVLVTGNDLRLGSGSGQPLLRLHADGTRDAAFSVALTAGIAGFPTPIHDLVVQPDGKLLVAGEFVRVNGQPAVNLARLNSNGTLDASFQPGVAGLNGPGRALALRPDGRIVVAGDFTTVQGQPRAGVAQLLPTGALDVAFAPATPLGLTARSLVLQADGNLLVGTRTRPNFGWPVLARLLPTGAADAAFQTGSGFDQLPNQFIPLADPVVQPDGSILVPTAASNFDGTPVGNLVRLLPTGSLDPAFDNLGAVRRRSFDEQLAALQVLAGGAVLVAGPLVRAGTPGTVPRPVWRLNAAGAADLTFAPRLLRPGAVRDVVRQPDGKLLIGGEFTELNGQPAAYLARLLPTGASDASFAAGTDGVVQSVGLQPNGQVLVAGAFDYLAGSPRVSVGRVLPTGAIDVSFAPPTRPLASAFTTSDARIWLQPDGNVLIGGFFNLRGPTARTQYFARLLGGTGQRDNRFVPADSTNSPTDVLVQANGRIVATGAATFGTQDVAAWRMLPSGALDPAFALLTAPAGGTNPGGAALTADNAGRLYIGRYYSRGMNFFADIVRTTANGQPDPTFQTAFNGNDVYNFTSLVVQPNGRLLVGGQFDFTAFGNGKSTVRLLANGPFDSSYAPSQGPAGGYVSRLLVQPDGAIVAAGDFANVLGLPLNGLVRLLDANVLTIKPAQRVAQLAAWPVPAHGRLNLRLDAATSPWQATLLDALGRPVLTGAAVAGPSQLLDTGSLPAGGYVLLVQYAGGSTTRRVMVE